MKKTFLKIFIFIMIIFLCPKVFAQEFNMNSYTSATKNGTTNRYRATEIYNTGQSSTYTFGTQYNGRISDIETYFNYPFVANTTYTLTYNMNTDDFRNNFGSSYWWDCDDTMTNTNATVVSPTYVSMRKVKFSFRTSDNTTCIRVWLRSTNLSSTAITGVSNWRLNSITIYDPDFQDGSSSGNQGSSSGNTTTDNTNSDIINSANQNTEEIIENNNNNTDTLNQSINSNCKDSTLTLTNDLSNHSGYYLNSSGNSVSSSGTNITKYIELKSNTSYTLKKLTGGSTPDGMSLCLYNVNKALSRCISYPSSDNFSQEFTPTNYEVYARFSIYSYRVFELTGYVCNNWDNENTQDIINNQNENTHDIINNQNQNTQQQIESQKVCNNISYQNAIINGYLNFTGNVVISGSSTKTTDYISVNSSSEITFTGGSNEVFCFYNNSKVKLSCNVISDYTSSSSNVIPVPAGSSYVRFTLKSSSDSVNYTICKNGNQSMTDTLTDDNIESGLGSDFFSDFQDNSHGLTGIITSPLTAIQSITSSTCQPLSIPIPFTNGSVSLPCMTQIYQDNIPTIYNIWKVVSFGIIAYFICIDIFHIVKGFKDPESDKVEVLDL